MPAKPDREPMPSPLPRCECGHPLPATRGVLLAEHNVHHADWLTPTLPTLAVPVVAAYRELADELRMHTHRLNARIVDLELELDAATYDLADRTEEVREVVSELEFWRDRVEELERELDDLNRNRVDRSP